MNEKIEAMYQELRDLDDQICDAPEQEREELQDRYDRLSHDINQAEKAGMNYLQRVVYSALCKNPALDEAYAHRFAVGARETYKLLNLDYKNRDFVAAELGCTPEHFDAFLMITKAIYNGGQCEAGFMSDRKYSEDVLDMLQAVKRE